MTVLVVAFLVLDHLAFLGISEHAGDNTRLPDRMQTDKKSEGRQKADRQGVRLPDRRQTDRQTEGRQKADRQGVRLPDRRQTEGRQREDRLAVIMPD